MANVAVDRSVQLIMKIVFYFLVFAEGCKLLYKLEVGHMVLLGWLIAGRRLSFA